MSDVAVQAIQSLVSLGVIALVFAFIYRYIFGSRTCIYKKNITDLYIIAKIKKLAKKEDIDLEEEEAKFLKSNSEKKDLDTQIEDQLVDQLEKDMESKTNSKK